MRDTTWLIGGLVLSSCSGTDALRETHPHWRVAPASLDLGSHYIGTSTLGEVRVINDGDSDLRFSDVSVQGDESFRIASDHAELVGAGTEVVIRIVFGPEQGGAHVATLQLRSNADPIDVSLTGEGNGLPECDDGNPCTSDSFDIASATCVTAPQDDACDDGDPCTENDACAAGECLGFPRSCDDADRCTLDVCDRNSGCVHLPDTAVCDDDDPCTQDLCTVDACLHPAQPDGTSCGALIDCERLPVCNQGVCSSLRAPDGFPCSDGNGCTSGDACLAGTCTPSSLVTGPASVLETVRSYGSFDASFVVLSDGRAVFDDSDGMHHRYTVVSFRSETLLVQASTTIGAPRDPGFVAPSNTLPLVALPYSDFIAMVQGDTLGFFDWRAFHVHESGLVETRGRAHVTMNIYNPSWAVGSVVYVCDVGGPKIIDFTDDLAPTSQPVVDQNGVPLTLCVDWLDPFRQTLFTDRVYDILSPGVVSAHLYEENYPVLVASNPNEAAYLAATGTTSNELRITTTTPAAAYLVIPSPPGYLFRVAALSSSWLLASLSDINRRNPRHRLIDISDPQQPVILADEPSGPVTTEPLVVAADIAALQARGYRSTSLHRVRPGTAEPWTRIDTPGLGTFGPPALAGARLFSGTAWNMHVLSLSPARVQSTSRYDPPVSFYKLPGGGPAFAMPYGYDYDISDRLIVDLTTGELTPTSAIAGLAVNISGTRAENMYAKTTAPLTGENVIERYRQIDLLSTTPQPATAAIAPTPVDTFLRHGEGLVVIVVRNVSATILYFRDPETLAAIGTYFATDIVADDAAVDGDALTLVGNSDLGTVGAVRRFHIRDNGVDGVELVLVGDADLPTQTGWVGSADLPYAGRGKILAHSVDDVVVADGVGISMFHRTEDGGLRLSGSLALDTPPVAATLGSSWVIASNNALYVVQPPCP